MVHRRTYLRTIASTGALGAIAGCTSTNTNSASSSTSSTTTSETNTSTTSSEKNSSTTTTTTNGSSNATVSVSNHDEYGKLLVGPDKMTLYLFTNDKKSMSTCYDSCAQTWPPLTVKGKPSAGDSVTASLGTTKRKDGSMQVTAAGQPLYYYAPDEKPGDTKGQEVGDVWYVVGPDGSKIEDMSEKSTEKTTTSAY